MSSVQRAFAHKLSKQHAADVRRQIATSTSYSRELSKSGSNFSGFSSTMSLCEVTEPLDYEDFLAQHQAVLDRDPLKSILDFPPNDVELRIIKRKIRTEERIVPFESIELVSPYVKRCIQSFTSDWLVVHRKFRRRASPIARDQLVQDTPRQDFEVDQEATNGSSGSPNEDESELSQSSQDTPRGSWASLDLRHSQHDPLLPSILDRVCPETLDQINEQKRLEDRQEALFPLYALPTLSDDEWQEITLATEPCEPFAHKILIKCLQLKLELEVEPIFASLALYDAKEKKKVSENFYVDMNSEALKRMLGSHVAYSDASTLARSCIINISKPSPDLFLVVRLEKVLQGDISECAEPYLRDDKNKDKVRAAAVVACERLGRYRMPFAWTAIHLSAVIGGTADTDSTGSAGSLDRKSGSLEQWRKKVEPPTRRGSLERRTSDKRRSWSPDDFANSLDNFRPITLTVSSFFKQESERLRDEDLYKLLVELRRPGSNLKRLKCIPGILKLDLSPRLEELPRCLDPDLRRLLPYPDEKSRPIKEILEFPSEIISPDLIYRNLLYVYPKEVNFSSRTGSARNIAVRVQLMGGEQESEALTAIFGRSSCPEMMHEYFTTVLYHNKNPNFYDEIKIRMPADLSARHHLLFTFYHISCQKKAEQPNVETPVAYTWLPLLRDGHLQSGEFSLPAMLDPPPANYSYIAPDVLLPGTRWVDAHRGVFTLILEPVSSVHPQDKYIDRFLSLCGALEMGQVPPRIGEAGMESELKATLLELARTSQTALIRSLPQIFDQLILLLMRPPTLPSQPFNVAATVFEAVGLLVRNITNMQDGQVDVHGRHPLLTTYTAFQCFIPRMTPGSGVERAQSNPDLPIEDLEMEIHSRGLDRTASMRQESMHFNNHCSPPMHRLLHEELALHWVVSTGQARELAITHSWFFFELIVRSMVITLAEYNLLDSPRKNRFSPQFADDLTTLVSALTTEIINRCSKDNRVASNLTSSLGNFLSDLFSVMDRGFVLSLLRTTCCSLADASVQVPDSAGLFALKLDLVRTVCSNEHYVALNLPFGTGYTSGSAPASPSPSTGSSGSLISTLVPAERARFSELSQEFRQQHFLVGLVLLDLSNTLEIPNPTLQNKAIGTLRYLMTCHDADPRYADSTAKARVAALYLPLLNILMDALPQLYHWDSKEKSVYMDESGSITQSVALAIAGGGAAEVAGTQCRVSLSSEATRHLLMCLLWLVKSLEKMAITQWISELSSRRVLSILQLLNIATAAFEYKGKKALKRLPSQATATSDIRSRLEDVILGQGSARNEMMLRRKERASGDRLRWRKDQMAYRLAEQPEGRVVEQDAHIEGALAAEASLVVLDTLETIVQADGGGGIVVGGVLKVLLRALARNQSTLVLQHMFNTQRALVFKYHSALFDEEESERCGDLCLTLLTRCSSPLSAVRSHAAASLYLLMRQNFEIGNNFARVKMQVTTSLSALVGRGRAPSEGALRRALKTVLVYAEKDSELADTSFPEQVKDLLFNLHMILSDTVKMKEFQEDPEMLLDLMYRIAKGYQGSPDLRLTWLANMAQQHMERKNHTEAAMCLVHSAALVAEYLHLLEPGGGGRPIGAVALSPISPNALEESAVGDDVLARREEGLCLGPDFSESGLAGLLEHAASSFHAAGMYEAIPDVYRVLLPIAEAAHDYKKLANIHGKLHEAYTRIEQLAGKRVFGTYFRVGFYGSRFGDLNGEEFIYKEPTLTKLPEIFSRLENFYAERFGTENVVIIKDSNPVDTSKLDPDKAFVQITYVEPYFEPHELRHRPTVFHRNFNIRRFLYATPFTPGGKAHGELREQCKRKTILTVATHFPYLKTRIRVVSRKQIVLSPIEVAIEDIQKKTVELAAATVQEPSDAKMLQMVLQGCIGTTVNQGPAEVANVFLSGLRDQNYQPSKLQHKLRLCFKDFSKKCLDALRKNKNLIGADQRDYQRELERNYQRLIERLTPLIAWSAPSSTSQNMKNSASPNCSRTGSARNIAVRVQLMGGEQESEALTAIFGRSSCPEMMHEYFTTVLYHNKNPNFYDEIKIRMPADLSARHHLLFTFYHISCQKKAEQPNVETPVAYTWLPLLRDGHLQSGEFSLPAMLDPPPANYSYIAPDVLLPGTRWVDAHRGVFTLILEPVSSVHPQDKYIDRFLSLCGALEMGQVPPRIGEAGMESELKATLLELARTSQTALIRSLPQIFDQLILLLMRPPTLPSQPFNVAATVFEAVGLLVRNITNMQDGQVDVHGRHPLLTTYTAFQCFIPRMTPGSGVERAQSNPDLPIEDLEMEIHSRGLDRTASMRQESMHFNNHCSPPMHRLLHEELALHWVVSTGQARELAITHSWFFFELIVRSMVITLAEYNLLDSPRKNRFSPQFADDLTTLVSALTTEIINRCSKDNRVASNLTSSLGNFLSDLFSVMDRGFVLSLLRTTCCSLADASVQVPDSAGLFALKLDLVRTVCSNEHYVALNLPFGTGYTSGSAPASPSPSTGSSGSLISTLVPAERARFSELSQEFRQQHFLVGLVLLDLSNTLEIPNPTLQNKAIGTLRYLMTCHDADPRYADSTAKARVAALYLPLLNILMDALPQLYHWDSKEKSVYMDESGSITQSVALAIAGGGAAEVAGTQCRVSLSSEATRHLLMCLLWLVKSLEKMAITQWISELSSRRVLSILQLLNIATAAFEYKGKKALKRLPSQATATSDIRSRLEDVILGQGSARNEMMLRRKERASGDRLRWRKDQMAYRLAEQPEGRVVEQDAHIEGALAAEASLVVLDTLETIVQADGGGGIVVGGVLKVLLRALARNQSTLVLQHMFNTQRALVFKYHSALFDEEESERCGDLCLTLLTRCSSPLSAVRSHAAASLYLLMRQNFEIGNNFARVKMQVTTSLSALVGRGRAPSEGALRRALKTVLVYAEKDSELADTSFPEQVKDLLFNLHMILSDTVKMKEFQEDPEMLLDLMYRIAKGYQGSPDLRLTWLANMAQQHMERKNHTEAAMCLVHSAALVAEYLHLLEPGGGGRPIGAVALSPISPNALEESAVGDDVLARREEGLCLGPDFSESGLAGLLEHAASSFHAAGMYEAIPDVYRVLLPIAEAAHDYKKLANIHGKLHEAYTRIEQLAGKRVFGTYFRVGFYGSRFGDLNGEEFIYKEPTLTKLPEIFSRLENFYAERFGTENVVIIKDSNPVDTSKLDPDKAFVQITYVEPYFEPHELRHRPTVFHRNFNIRRFLYATPFTPGGKAHGELREQCKRKTILTVATHFPYLKTRIRVVSRKQIVLSPIEVAIEDIQKKTVELAAATVQEPSDAKMLQMVLQGCIGTTVNQGPAEVANVFLSGLRDQNYQPSKLQHKLRLCFKDFSKKCLDALRKNKNLIGADQRDYQRELERNYQRLIERLTPLIAWSAPSSTSQNMKNSASPNW